MKKSESEVEVRARGTRHLSLVGLPQSGPAWPDPFHVPPGGSSHYCPAT